MSTHATAVVGEPREKITVVIDLNDCDFLGLHDAAVCYIVTPFFAIPIAALISDIEIKVPDLSIMPSRGLNLSSWY